MHGMRDASAGAGRCEIPPAMLRHSAHALLSERSQFDFPSTLILARYATTHAPRLANWGIALCLSCAIYKHLWSSSRQRASCKCDTA